MSEKIYYSFDPHTGEYLGSGEADPSPLEPGVYLIPAHSTVSKPPIKKEKQAIIRVGGGWGYAPDYRGEIWYKGETPHTILGLGDPARDGFTRAPVAVTPEPIEPTPVNLEALAADVRWRVEEGGATWNGWPVFTDRVSQNKIGLEVIAILTGDRNDTRWKFADGVFRQVSNEEFTSMSSTVRQHVVNAFATEELVLAKIADGSITTEHEIVEAFNALPQG